MNRSGILWRWNLVGSKIFRGTSAGLWGLIFLSAVSAQAQAVYSYQGEPYSLASPPYSVGGNLEGGFSLVALLPSSFPATDISGLLLDFSFDDGVQVLDSGNSTVCDFTVATDAIGNISSWSVSLRGAPFPGVGNPQETIFSGGIDRVGTGPAFPGECDQIGLSTSAESSTAGTWSTPGMPPGPGALYFYQGDPYTLAAPPYSLGGSLTGEVSVTSSLPAFLPATDISVFVLDFSFDDGAQVMNLGNSTVCDFTVATDAIGNISSWSVSLRGAPFPGVGNPQGAIFSGGIDRVGTGPAFPGECDQISLSTSAESSAAGTWAAPGLPPTPGVPYSYLGEPYTQADPPYALGGNLSGQIITAGALTPLLPATDISGLLLDFSFGDGVQVMNPGNSTVCDFTVATDAIGRIISWSVSLRGAPFPGAGNPQGTISSGGIDRVGTGPAFPGECDQISLTTSAASTEPGTWTGSFSVPSIPALSTIGLVVFSLGLLGAASLVLRQRN